MERWRMRSSMRLAQSPKLKAIGRTYDFFYRFIVFMRKCFLLIAIVSFAFLWLGYYSSAQTQTPNCVLSWSECKKTDGCKWFSETATQSWICKACSDSGVCCGIELNTNVPFIGKCIESETGYASPWESWVTWEKAFPVLMGSLTKILVTVILIVSFVLIIIGGIMIATGNPSWGKKMIINVVIGIALLGASWVILRLINPNFFG